MGGWPAEKPLEGEGLVVVHEGMPHVVVGLDVMGHAQGIQVTGKTVTWMP